MTQPKRAARITEEQQTQIVRLDIRGVSQSDIARLVKVNRTTVKRVLDRVGSARLIDADTRAERGRALAVYREIQATAWLAVAKATEHGRSPAMLLAEIRMAQQRIDDLLGLAPSQSDDPVLMLAAFKSTVTTLILEEAPELGPRLAQRLLEMREDT